MQARDQIRTDRNTAVTNDKKFYRISGVYRPCGRFPGCDDDGRSVAQDEINKKTYESKIAPGLLCIDEILDLDGDTRWFQSLRRAFRRRSLQRSAFVRFSDCTDKYLYFYEDGVRQNSSSLNLNP